MIPYITFEGNCEEVLHYYKEKLMGEIVSISTFKNTPNEVPENHQDKIMHAEFKFGANTMMASDGMPGLKVIRGNHIAFSVNCQNLDEAKTYFNNLAEDGKIEVELQETFWGAIFGMLEDKYGIRWMFNIEIQK